MLRPLPPPASSRRLLQPLPLQSYSAGGLQAAPPAFEGRLNSLRLSATCPTGKEPYRHWRQLFFSDFFIFVFAPLCSKKNLRCTVVFIFKFIFKFVCGVRVFILTVCCGAMVRVFNFFYVYKVKMHWWNFFESLKKYVYKLRFITNKQFEVDIIPTFSIFIIV